MRQTLWQTCKNDISITFKYSYNGDYKRHQKADFGCNEGQPCELSERLEACRKSWHQLGCVLAAKTATFKYIWAQLTACQGSSLSAIMCDMPNIGKTFTAREYVKQHRNAIYVDCSQVKTKRALVRKIAKEFGVSANGTFGDIYEDLVFYIRTVENPLIVLDEAGDLAYEAFLELKALWNATERCCAWYMMGADGLKAKIDRSVEGKKVGYAEMLSRYGDRFCKVTPDDGKERLAFLMEQAQIVAEANAPKGADIRQIVLKTGGALRRVYTEIEKVKAV